jgi:hypothetical protein
MRATRVLALLPLLLAPPAAAQPILHEYVPPPGTGAPAAGGKMPTQISVGDRTLKKPPAPRERQRGERLLSGDPRRSVRMDRITPDRTTTHDGVLRYRAEFNPSVVPFKRMTAMDAVGPDYALRVRDRTLRPVRVAKVPSSPDRDMFWGSLMLHLTKGRPVPIPSVAPSARILSYTTTPPTRVRFFRDSADNFWVQAAHTGQLRIVFLSDAPRRYFSPRVPPMVTVAHVPTHLRPRLPADVRNAANRVIKQIGVNPRATLRRQLERLAAYFRNFRPGELPRITGDTYLDIALSQRGVCRHRSFAFVITAHALGIPARYVQNEAHAFTEVFVPRMGWARLDLGGASSELQVSGARDKAVHAPGPDPFPSPSRYATGYSRLNRGVRGIRSSQRLRRSSYRVALDSLDRSRSASGTGGTGAGTAAGRPGPAAQGGAEVVDPSLPPEVGEGAPTDPQPALKATQISAYTGARSVFRGEQIAVWGRVTADGKGAPGLKVQLYLSRDSKVTDALLGATVTGADGRFSVSLPVPVDVQVGRYRVFATTPGDQQHEASISR